MPPSPDANEVPPLRKADFWTSLVLLALAAGMLVETLTYPLEGSYAGVRNAWYVSPALLPLIVALTLIVLSGPIADEHIMPAAGCLITCEAGHPPAAAEPFDERSPRRSPRHPP